MKRVLVTGCAGFIGWKISEMLLEKGYEVIGIDNLNNYYDVRVKEWRLNALQKRDNFLFYKADITSMEDLENVFKNHDLDAVINEAAYAGVIPSIKDPWTYFKVNSDAVINILELMKEYGVKKFVLPSTSALYAGQKMPFKEDLPVNTPISPYAASKKSAEVISYTYHYLYDIDVSVVRYFTVYGPAGRPDMSIFRFIYWVMKSNPLVVYGDGTQSRDFTYVDDIAKGTIASMEKKLGYEIINLGGKESHTINEVIELIEKYTGRKAQIDYKEFLKGDMRATHADIEKAKRILNWEPEVSLEEGIRRTVEWFKENWDWVKDVVV